MKMIIALSCEYTNNCRFLMDHFLLLTWWMMMRGFAGSIHVFFLMVPSATNLGLTNVLKSPASSTLVGMYTLLITLIKSSPPFNKKSIVTPL